MKRLSATEYSRYDVRVLPADNKRRVKGRMTQVTDLYTGKTESFLGDLSKAEAIKNYKKIYGRS